MFRRSLHLVLVLGLAASPALSAASTPWSVILFDLLHRPGSGITLKAGCSINPDGQPLCQKRERRVPRPGSDITSKSGCGISPDGQPLCQKQERRVPRPLTLKHGCTINPDGQTFCQP